MNFMYREGESLEEAWVRYNQERSQRFIDERRREQREREMEERLYRRLLEALTKNITVKVNNEASPVIKQITKDLNDMLNLK